MNAGFCALHCEKSGGAISRERVDLPMIIKCFPFADPVSATQSNVLDRKKVARNKSMAHVSQPYHHTAYRQPRCADHQLRTMHDVQPSTYSCCYPENFRYFCSDICIKSRDRLVLQRIQLQRSPTDIRRPVVPDAAGVPPSHVKVLKQSGKRWRMPSRRSTTVFLALNRVDTLGRQSRSLNLQRSRCERLILQ